MTKILALIVSLSFTSAAFANEKLDCAEQAEQAVSVIEAGGNSDTLARLTAGATLVSRKASALVYSVEVFEQSSDGASTVEFEHSLYEVKATGNRNNCKITSVKSVKAK